MEIAKVAEQAAVTAQTAPKTSVQTSTEKAKSTLTADNADKYVKSEDTFTPAYTKKSAQKKRGRQRRQITVQNCRTVKGRPPCKCSRNYNRSSGIKHNK